MVLQGENPYIVNSILNLVKSNDYMRLQDDYKALEERFKRLFEVLSDNGINVIINEKGDFEIYDRNGK